MYSVVQQVDVMDSKDEAHLALMTRPELGVTLTKLHAWTLTQYKKCVFMDADTLVCVLIFKGLTLLCLSLFCMFSTVPFSCSICFYVILNS